MKDFSGLQSSLLLCVILAFSEQESVSVGCTCSTFWAMVEPTLLGQDQVLHPDEVSLGTGCPVTEVTARGYKFNYPVTECGIQKEVFSYGVIFYSALYYNIMSKGVTGKIPLMCIVSRKCGKCCLDQYEDLLSSSEDCHMNISCSMDWVMVSVGPCAYSSSLYIFADELYLGLGCPVTRIQTYAYDFIYPVHDCGIRTKVVSEDTLLFQTEIYFNPRNTHCDCQKIPLECSASRKSVWLTLVSTDNEIRLDPSPFIADFETTPEEVGLLNPSQTVSLPKEKWKFGIGIMNFVGKNIFIPK